MVFKNLLSSQSIRAKLITMTLGIVISIVLGLTAVITYTTARMWEDESKRQLYQNLEQSLFLLRNFIEVRENNVELWRNNQLVETIFDTPSMASIFKPSLRAEFRKIREKEPWMKHIFLTQGDHVLYDDSGQFIFSPAKDDLPSGLKVLDQIHGKGVSVSNLKYLSPDREGEILVIKRPFLKDNLAFRNSAITVVYNLQTVFQKLFGKVSIGKHGFLALASQNAFTGLNLHFPIRSGIEVDDLMETALSWKNLRDIPEAYGSIIIQQQKLKGYPLVLIGVVSLNDFHEPVQRLLYLSAVFGAIAILLGIGTAVFYATRLTVPIKQLTRKAQQIAGGDKGIEEQLRSSEDSIISSLGTFIADDRCALVLPDTKQDELSILNSTFDAMADKLDQDTKRLLSLTRIFEKFVPSQFLNRVITGGLDGVALGKGERDYITILFSDIRSFTTYSESMEPEDLFSFLNEYLSAMNRQIHKQHGFIDKFIGDAIMALFDHPEQDNNAEAESAVQAAISMQEALREFNRQRGKQGFTPIKTGIGIHSGSVMIGTIGSEKRMDFTVLGDNVNLASRIEALTKFYGVDILISVSTLRLLSNLDQYHLREMDWVKVKGKSEPVELYEIYNMDPPEIQELKRKAGSSILRGLTQRRRKNWDKAVAAFEKALAIYPEDQAAAVHIKRCHELQHQDLPDNWDGAIELDKK